MLAIIANVSPCFVDHGFVIEVGVHNDFGPAKQPGAIHFSKPAVRWNDKVGPSPRPTFQNLNLFHSLSLIRWFPKESVPRKHP